MKSFYFNSASRAKYYAVRQWMRLSILLSSLTLFGIFILYVPEYIFHQELAQQHKQLYSLALTHTKQPTDISSMQVTFAKVEKRKKQADYPPTLLKKIKNLCKDDSNLESLSIKPHNIQITLAAKNAPTLITIADNLALQPSCGNLYISSLEPKEQRMIAILKSTQETRNS
jgi:hypothetical protein